MSKNARHLLAVAVLVIVATFPVYFLLNAIYTFSEPASVQAEQIQPMFDVHFILISFLFSLIMVFMIYSVVVFRRKPGDEGEGQHFHGHTGLEITWTIVPLIIVIALGIWAAVVLSEVTAEEEGEMAVEVIGRQWSWVFSYPDYPEIGTSNELVLPVNRPVRLEMRSEDVLHSFWVPEFRVKQDLVPGITTILRLTPSKEGDYKVRCAEICGFLHSAMLGGVQVVSEKEFADWVAEKSGSIGELSPEQRGEKWASDYGCVGCHSLDGTQLAGPTWQGILGREERLTDGTTVVVDETYLAESILMPGAKIVEGYVEGLMPANFGERFSADEAELLANSGVDISIVDDLVAYLKSLSE